MATRLGPTHQPARVCPSRSKFGVILTPPKKGFTLDPDALLFLAKYASERGLKLSPALSELLLHLTGEDKSNPKLVKESLEKALQKE